MKKKSASRSAFFNPKAIIGLLLAFAGVMLALLGFRNVSAQSPTTPQTPFSGIYQGLSPVVHFDISPPLRDITPVPPDFGGPVPAQEKHP